MLMALALCLPIGASAYDLPEPREQYPPADLNRVDVNGQTQVVVVNLVGEVFDDAELGPVVVFEAEDDPDVPVDWNSLKLDAVQPGDSFVITFRYKNTMRMGTQPALPVVLSPHLSALFPDMGAPGTRRAADKFTFRVYTQLFKADYLSEPGNEEHDYFRDAGRAKRLRELETPLPAGVPQIQRRQTELDWVSHLSRENTVVLDEIEPEDVLYIHYWFYWDGSLNAIAPASPGEEPNHSVRIDPATGRHPQNCDAPDCTHDNHYMNLEFRLEWKLYAEAKTVPNPSPLTVGYTLRHQAVDGTILKPDEVTPASSSGLRVGDTWNVPTPIADIVYNGNIYRYTQQYRAGASSTAQTGQPTLVLVANSEENVLTLVYEWYVAPPTGGGGSTPRTIVPVIYYQDELGATLRPSRTLPPRNEGSRFTYAFDAAVDTIENYTFIGYIPNPPDFLLSGSNYAVTLVYRVVPEQPPEPPPGGGDDVVDTPPPLEQPEGPGDGTGGGEDIGDATPPLGPPTKPDVPYTGGFDLTDLFFVGVLLLVLGFLYYWGEKKRKQFKSETREP
ncbi:MAG: hypothetical protein LBH86_09625 [Oscillospiraceae bacterium]|nr:hypothetical protein [Oscillospiraceae bacterium]